VKAANARQEFFLHIGHKTLPHSLFLIPMSGTPAPFPTIFNKQQAGNISRSLHKINELESIRMNNIPLGCSKCGPNNQSIQKQAMMDPTNL
jgi:hypothetical protein